MENCRERWSSIFADLGDRLAGFGDDARSREAIAAAVAANPWFSREEIIFAAGSLRDYMLRGDILERWLAQYDMDYSHPGKVAIIMAGNIPLVGFFDMMCVLACGHECYIKPSSKDTVLIEYIAGLLKDIAPGIAIGQYSDTEQYDAVIATGSDNTNRYFREKFSGTAALLRAGRYSAALLDGAETVDDIRALAEDIFRYNGMGCRSVSLLFLPQGYNVKALAKSLSDTLPLRKSSAAASYTMPLSGTLPLSGTMPETAVQIEKMNLKYIGNYRQVRGLMTVLGQDFIDGGCFVMVPARDFPAALSVVNYTFYDDMEEVRSWLSANSGTVQAVVSRSGDLSVYIDENRLGENLSAKSGKLDLMQFTQARFGQAQHPAPWDYPDCRDVIYFLTDINRSLNS